MIKKRRKAATLAKLGKDKMRVDTTRRIEGIALIDLSGRMTLIVRNALRDTEPGRISSKPVMTTKKSMTFHPSLK